MLKIAVVNIPKILPGWKTFINNELKASVNIIHKFSTAVNNVAKIDGEASWNYKPEKSVLIIAKKNVNATQFFWRPGPGDERRGFFFPEAPSEAPRGKFL